MNVFGYDWNMYRHTKWDSSRYDQAYFGPVGVTLGVDPNYIKLAVVEKPEYFEKGEIFPNASELGVEKKYCCGEVNGPTLSYGTYTWKVEMPYNEHLWPALWLCGKQSWPPEIDVVEGYTDDRGDYIRFAWSTRLETNFHRREIINGEPTKGTHVSLGAQGIPTWKYLLWHKKVDEYKCVWTPKYIKIYFNGHLIRTTKDENLLKDLNADAQMYPIMNIMIDDGYVHDPENPPVMIIRNFTYKSI